MSVLRDTFNQGKVRQTATEKIVTVHKALSDYKPKGDKVSFEEALTRTVDLKRAGRGPV